MPKKKEAPQPLPCPGYGETPVIYRSSAGRWGVACGYPGCPCKGISVRGSTEEEAVLAWNREVKKYED